MNLQATYSIETRKVTRSKISIAPGLPAKMVPNYSEVAMKEQQVEVWRKGL